MRNGLEELVVELPRDDVKRKIDILKKLHENRIIYKIESYYLIIEGFDLDIVEEDSEEELFIKYDVNLRRGIMAKWVYVKIDDPNVYYRIKALHSPSNERYIKALKRRRNPKSYIRMALETLNSNETMV
ncbi:MAG: hypothetical protein QXI93_02820 [Candidatus Methanomethylicia archaeon]